MDFEAEELVRADRRTGARASEGNPEQSDILLLRPVLAFADSSYEQRFVRHYNHFYYRYAQISLTVGLVLIFADFLVDFLVAPQESANFYRIQLCLPILGTGIACSFTPYARRHWQPIMAGFIAMVAFSLFWVLLVIDRQGGMGLKSWVGILNFVFLEFYCFVILGVRFNYAFVSGTLILLGFESAIFSEFATDRQMFLYWSYQVLTAFILATGIGWWREFVLRNDFSTQATLKAAKDILGHQNTMLEREVRRRTHELLFNQDAAILTLAALVEARDSETGATLAAVLVISGVETNRTGSTDVSLVTRQPNQAANRGTNGLIGYDGNVTSFVDGFTNRQTVEQGAAVTDQNNQGFDVADGICHFVKCRPVTINDCPDDSNEIRVVNQFVFDVGGRRRYGQESQGCDQNHFQHRSNPSSQSPIGAISARGTVGTSGCLSKSASLY